ncbi:MAG: extracellular solute-binding protein [Anaerolineae bacterium]
MKTRWFVVVALVIVTGLLLSACSQAAPQVQIVKETVIVEATKIVEKVVEATTIVEITSTPAPDRVQITWYIGLGAGAQPAQIPLEKDFVEKFNKSQNEIQLIPIIVDNKYARDNLTAQIAAGNAPDVVGPVGTAGRAAFPGAFLDIEPLIKEANYDTSDIDPAFLQFYKDEGKLVGLPFAIFPEFVYYNQALFDEAKLAYPPQKYGAKYTLDGKEVDWNFDTVAEVAKRLTVDAQGNDATQAGFDAKNIVQYGYITQWSEHPRATGSLFGAFYPVDSSGNGSIPDTTVAAWKWYYDSMWGKQPFQPNQAAIDSDLLKGNAFSSGKVAMATTHLWYTCCIDKATVPSWNVAVMPSYNGKVTSKMHGDTFAILGGTKHPKEAFKVYTYMLTTGSADLYKIYGGLPARKSQQTDFFASLDEKFAPVKANWQVALDSIPFMDVPNHELGTPNYAKTFDLFSSLGSDFRSNPDLKFDERIATFKSELDKVLKEKP